MLTITVDDEDETSDSNRQATANDEELARQLQVSVSDRYLFVLPFCKCHSVSYSGCSVYNVCALFANCLLQLIFVSCHLS